MLKTQKEKSTKRSGKNFLKIIINIVNRITHFVLLNARKYITPQFFSQKPKILKRKAREKNVLHILILETLLLNVQTKCLYC